MIIYFTIFFMLVFTYQAYVFKIHICYELNYVLNESRIQNPNSIYDININNHLSLILLLSYLFLYLKLKHSFADVKTSNTSNACEKLAKIFYVFAKLTNIFNSVILRYFHHVLLNGLAMILNSLKYHLQYNNLGLRIIVKERVLLDIVGALELYVDSHKLQLKLVFFYEANIVAYIV